MLLGTFIKNIVKTKYMKEINLSIPTIDSIKELFEPLLQKISLLEEKLNNLNSEKEYYRNKDLKKKFGLANKTIQTYRELNVLPYTFIGEIYFYPVDEVNQIMAKNSNFQFIKK
jgi:hypothetical protein